MKLFNTEEYDSAKQKDLLLCKCDVCQIEYHKTKKAIYNDFFHDRKHDICSKQCGIVFQTKAIKLNCKQCNIPIIKALSNLRKVKNSFCSQKCSGIYSMAHRTTGNSRSKLEFWIESQLTIIYPILEIHYNKREAINSELDIYIPSLKLAFELNGIFHYEQIFPNTKLETIQNNDERKFQSCIERGISLCIIDTSKQKYFKENTSLQFLNIITSVINSNIINDN